MTIPEDACIRHFIQGFDIYMRSMIKEAKDRETLHVRPIDDYLQLRRETFGAQATISFLSFGLGLPEHVVSHPIMKTVTLAAMNLLCIINVSFSSSIEEKASLQIVESPPGHAFLPYRTLSRNRIPQHRHIDHSRTPRGYSRRHEMARRLRQKRRHHFPQWDKRIAIVGTRHRRSSPALRQ